MTKMLVKAWFRGNFQVIRSGSSQMINLSIRRQPFLKEHINPFLESVGLRRWTSRSALYTDWFLRKVLRLPAAERNSTQPWKFHRLTSKLAFKEQLEKLIAATLE